MIIKVLSYVCPSHSFTKIQLQLFEKANSDSRHKDGQTNQQIKTNTLPPRKAIKSGFTVYSSIPQIGLIV